MKQPIRQYQLSRSKQTPNTNTIVATQPRSRIYHLPPDGWRPCAAWCITRSDLESPHNIPCFSVHVFVILFRNSSNSPPSKTYIYTISTHLQHRLQVIRNRKRSLGLAPDLVHRHAVRDLDQRQSGVKVDVKHAELRDDARDTRTAGEGECAFCVCPSAWQREGEGERE